MELLESDTLQNKIDFPSIGKNVIFCKEKKKKKKHPVFFHRSSGNRIQTFQSSLPVGCEVSECALVGPGASTTAFVQSACINFGIDRVREDNGAALLSQNNFGLTNPLKGPQEAAHHSVRTSALAGCHSTHL